MREGGGGSGQRNFDGLDLCWRVLGTRLCSEEERNTKAQKYRETLLSALHSLKIGAIF